MESAKKRLLSGFMALVMAFSLLPAQAFAWGMDAGESVILPIGDDAAEPQIALLSAEAATPVYASSSALSVELPRLYMPETFIPDGYDARVQALNADGQVVARTAAMSLGSERDRDNGTYKYYANNATLFFLDELPAGEYAMQVVCGNADSIQAVDMTYTLNVVDAPVITYGSITNLKAFEGVPDSAAELRLRINGYQGDPGYTFSLLNLADGSTVSCSAEIAGTQSDSGYVEVRYLLTPSSPLSAGEGATYALQISGAHLYNNADTIQTTYQKFVPGIAILDITPDTAKVNQLNVKAGGVVSGTKYTVRVTANGDTLCEKEFTAAANGNETFCVTLSKHGLELPLSAYGDSFNVEIRCTESYDYMTYYMSGDHSQSAQLSLTKTSDTSCSFVLTGRGLLLDLYEASTLPALTLQAYDQASGRPVVVGTASGVQKRTYTQSQTVCYEFTGTITTSSPLSSTDSYYLFRSDTNTMIASGWLSSVGGGLFVTPWGSLPVSGRSFYFVFGKLPLDVILGGCGDTATAELYDLTTQTVAASQTCTGTPNAEYGGMRFMFQIPQPENGIDESHKYAIRFTSGGETVSLGDVSTSYAELAYDSAVGNLHVSSKGPVFAGETELVFIASLFNWKNLPADYLKNHPIRLVQSGAEIGVASSDVTVDFESGQCLIRVTTAEPLTAGTYSYGSNGTFTVLPADSMYLGDWDGTLISGKNFPSGTYSGTLYRSDTWRNGGNPVLTDVNLERVDGETLRVASDLSGLPSDSYNLEIQVDGKYMGTVSIWRSQASGVSIAGYDTYNRMLGQIEYLTKSDTINLLTNLPGYAYVRYSLNSNFSGAPYQPVQPYYNQRLDLGADGEKTVYVQFRKSSGEESRVYTWKCRKDSQMADPALVSVQVLVDGQEVHSVPQNTEFTVRAVANTQYADVTVGFIDTDNYNPNTTHYSRSANLAYKGAAEGGCLFEATLNSGNYPYNNRSFAFTNAVFLLHSFSGDRAYDTEKYPLTFAHEEEAAGISLDDWNRPNTAVYTKETSYTVNGTTKPNAAVTVEWGKLPYNPNPVEGDVITKTATADENGRFSVEFTGLPERKSSESKLHAYLTDDANTSIWVYLVVDQTAPVIKNLRASVAPESDDNAAITWDVEELNGVHYIIWRDGLLIEENYYNNNYIALRAEDVEYTIQAVDAAGNLSKKETITVRGDINPPEVSITRVSPDSGETIGGTKFLTVQGSAKDDKGLGRVELQYDLGDGKGFQPATTDSQRLTGTEFNWTITFREAENLKSCESLQVKAVVYDSSGNPAEAGAWTFHLDNTPPATPTNFFASSGDTGIDLEWSHEKKEADFASFRVYRSAAEDGTFSRIASKVTECTYLDSAGLTTGSTYYYYVTAVDTLGNESEPTPVSSAVNTVDNEKPTITVSPAGSIIVRDKITITVEASDNNKLGKCVISLKDGETLGEKEPEHSTKSYTYSFEIDASKLTGSGVIQITVSDAKGNTAVEAVNYKQYTAPVAPSSLQAAVEENTVKLTWEYGGDPAMLSIFAVYRSSGDEGSFEYVGSIPAETADPYEYTDTVGAGGTYRYRVTAVDKTDPEGSKDSDAVSVTVESSDKESPVAVIGPAGQIAVQAGQSIALTGAASTDNVKVASYSWNFGDGSEAAAGVDVTHTYAEAGEYTVKLTVTDDAGNKGEAEAKVTVLTEAGLADYTQTTFTVSSAKDGKGLDGAELALVQVNEKGGETASGFSDRLRTGADGKVTVLLPNGRYRVNASHPDYGTRSVLTEELTGGTAEIAAIGLGGALRGKMKSEVLNKEQIEALGIDTSDPANQHVVMHQVTLGFDPQAVVEVEYYTNESGEVVKGGPVRGNGYTFYPVSERFALVVYGEAHWLKEMFKVELLVFNDSATDELNGVTATLNLPEGLSLAAMTAGEQSAVQQLGNIGKDGQAAATWYIRGDTEGEYDLSATVKAVSMPFGEAIEQTFTTEEALKVYAGSALHMTIIPDAIARKGEPYHVRFKLTNTTADRPVYHFSYRITKSQQFGITSCPASTPAGVIVEKLAEETYGPDAYSVSVETLEPGQSVELDFVTTIQFNSVLEKLKDLQYVTPGRYVDVYYLLRDVWVSTLEGSTTSIPWSVEVNANVRWPVLLKWKNYVKYTTAYGDLFDIPTAELLEKYAPQYIEVSSELDGPVAAAMSKGGESVLELDQTDNPDLVLFVAEDGASARAANAAGILSAVVSESGDTLTIQAKDTGTENITFGVKDTQGNVLEQWTYAFTVTEAAADAAETLTSTDGTYAVSDDAWNKALEEVKAAEKEMLTKNPTQSLDSVLSWTLEGSDGGYEVSIAPAKLKALLEQTAVTSMCFNSACANLSFDHEALEELAKADDVSISANSSNGKYTFLTGGVSAQVTLPYALKTGENTVCVEYLDAEGKVTKVLSNVYDSTAQTVTFVTDNSDSYRIRAVSAPVAGTGYTIDFIAETISAAAGYEVSRSQTFTQILPANAAITPGEKLYVRAAAQGDVPASLTREVTVPNRPAAPTVTSSAATDAATADGKILGTTTAMEYSVDGGSTWITCTEGEIAGLAAGTYQVRVKATVNMFASSAASVAVEHGTGGTPSRPDFPGFPYPPFIPGIPGIPDTSSNSSQPAAAAPAVTNISNGQIKTPVGMDAVVSSDRTVTLPGGGDIQRNDGISIVAPAGTIVRPDGTVVVPSKSEVSLTLPSGTQLVLPGGSTIGNSQILVGMNGADIPSGTGGTQHVEEGTVLILDNTVPLGFYVLADAWINPFADVAESAWYYDAVKFVSKNGLMNGVGSDKFDADGNLTRAMLTQVLYNKENQPVTASESVYTDVAADAWYYNAVTWASAAEIVSGYGNGLFGPDDYITREQLATMLWRYAGRPTAASQTLNFSDASEASGYALDALCWAVANGVINGMGDNTLAPKGLATRAQVAQMLKNYLDR